MKFSIFLFSIFTFLFFSCSKNEEALDDYSKESGTFVDERDGHEYKWVKIGEQIWMAENLAYLPEVSDNANHHEPRYHIYNYFGTSIEEAKGTNIYQTYGVLFNWNAAKESCPEGWHLPSIEEWDQLARYIANSKGYPERDIDEEKWEKVGKHLKAKGTIEDGDGLWVKYYDPNPDDMDKPDIVHGTDDYGFAAVPGGIANWNQGGDFEFESKGFRCYFWSSNMNGEYYAHPYSLNLSDDFRGGESGYTLIKKGSGMSVRCVKD